MHIADNYDALLDYLYEEGDSAERLAIARHLQECAACSVAVLELQSVRGMLREWNPPPAGVGFRIVRDIAAADAPAAAPVDRLTAATGRMAWWAQAAAAVLVFLAGMAASQLRVDVENGTIAFGQRSEGPSPAVRHVSITLPPESAAVAATGAVAQGSDAPANRSAASNAAEIDTERLLQRVRAMIDQSEQRQQRELALRVSQMAREVDTQHQADLLRIQQNFGKQQELVDYLVRTSGGLK